MTRFSQIIKRYIIDSQVWVSICFVGLAAFYQLIIQKLEIPLLILFFFATLLVYNLSYYAWTGGKRRLVLILLSVIPVVAITILYLNIYSIFLLSVQALFSILYAIPLKNKKLRDIPYLKIYLISFVWASSIVFLPILNANEKIQTINILHFVAFFLYVMAITIPFDIRDYLRDDLKLKTIPQLIGVEKSIKLSKICLIILLIVTFFTLPKTVLFIFIIETIILNLLLKKRLLTQPYICSIYIEMQSLLPLLMYFILN